MATREDEIKAKEQAIKRRLTETNTKARMDAISKTDPKKGGTKKYSSQYIKGSSEGFTKSDYGVGSGAAIPYQIGSKSALVTVKGTASKKPTKTIKNPKPIKKGAVISSKTGHTKYKVKKGDTLSSIAKKHGMNWKDIWNYNLKNRSSKVQKVLKSRGPNTIYRGGTFYIPKR